MPIIASRNLFRFIVAELQGVGFSELGDGFIHPSDNAEVMAVHMLGVRNRGAEPGVNLTVFDRLLRVSDRVESMHQIMLGSRIVGRDCQISLLVGNGSLPATVAAERRRGIPSRSA